MDTPTQLKLRKELDHLMLHLDQLSAQEALPSYIQAGQLMVQMGILHEKDKENISQIVHTYKNYTTYRLTKIMKQRQAKNKKE